MEKCVRITLRLGLIKMRIRMYFYHLIKMHALFCIRISDRNIKLSRVSELCIFCAQLCYALFYCKKCVRIALVVAKQNEKATGFPAAFAFYKSSFKSFSLIQPIFLNTVPKIHVIIAGRTNDISIKPIQSNAVIDAFKPF